MSPELELVQASLVTRLRAAGLTLPDEEARALAEDLLDEALRLSLAWLEAAPVPASAA